MVIAELVSPLLFIGIDLQIRRPCATVVLDREGRMIDSGWLKGSTGSEVGADLIRRIELLTDSTSEVRIGIDAPRRALSKKRAFFWDRQRAGWRKRRPSERGWGRHCEVIVRSCGLANPQWTPLGAESPDWMKLGFGLFRELERRGFETHEVFPSAAYTQLAGEPHLPVELNFSSFAGGPKDMLDACAAAFTVREYHAGRGAAVGDDGLGQIILPRPLPETTPASLLVWPDGI